MKFESAMRKLRSSKVIKRRHDDRHFYLSPAPLSTVMLYHRHYEQSGWPTEHKPASFDSDDVLAADWVVAK